MRAGTKWVLATWLAIGAGATSAQSPADSVVQQLREQGYVEFAVSRTLLGRTRVTAIAPNGGQREIVFNPATGEILRDYVEAADGGSTAPRIMDRPAGEPDREARAGGASEDNRGAGQGNGGDHQGNGNGGGQGNSGQSNGNGNGGGQGKGQGGGKGQGNGD